MWGTWHQDQPRCVRGPESLPKATRCAPATNRRRGSSKRATAAGSTHATNTRRARRRSSPVDSSTATVGHAGSGTRPRPWRAPRRSARSARRRPRRARFGRPPTVGGGPRFFGPSSFGRLRPLLRRGTILPPLGQDRNAAMPFGWFPIVPSSLLEARWTTLGVPALPGGGEPVGVDTPPVESISPRERSTGRAEYVRPREGATRRPGNQVEGRSRAIHTAPMEVVHTSGTRPGTAVRSTGAPSGVGPSSPRRGAETFSAFAFLVRCRP